VTPKLPVTLDTKGRVRTSEEQPRVILAEFGHSGVSAPEFAHRAGVKYSTLAAWVQRYRRTKRPGIKVARALVGSSRGTSVAQFALGG
jgi:hypothetical protein